MMRSIERTTTTIARGSLHTWLAHAGATLAICAGVTAQEPLDTGKPGLPPEAQHAVAKAYPDALIQEAELQDDDVKFYDVQINDGGREITLRMLPDGTLIETETSEYMKALPAADAEAIKANLPKGAKVVEVLKRDIRARIKADHVVPLTTPTVRYDVEYVAETTRGNIELGPNKAGRLVVKSRNEETIGEDGDEEE